jgi:hypothetical protein
MGLSPLLKNLEKYGVFAVFHSNLSGKSAGYGGNAAIQKVKNRKILKKLPWKRPF